MRTAAFLHVGLVSGYAFIANQPGIKNSHLLARQQPGGNLPGGPEKCPFNPNHVPAVPVNAEFNYNGAIGGLPGRGIGGYQVPAPNDTAHQFIAPTDQDIRGPCPGLNALANHGFLARDGITEYTELVDAVQNVYNMGYDLANFLAVFSIYIADGDWVTSKLSIGCDATTRTSASPVLTGSQPGLDGHNKFEADASLTRNDYFPSGGQNFELNTTLWAQMTESTGGLYDLAGLAKYRYEKYVQDRTSDPNFFFGPLALFQYGAASFVYELMPNGNEGYVPNVANTASFFGVQQESDGTWSHSAGERIPDNWTNRVDPYSLIDVVTQILLMYNAHPVGIGGNADGVFVGVDFPPYIQEGNFTAVKPEDAACFLYQFVSAPLIPIPSSLNGVVTPSVEVIQAVLVALGGEAFTNLGCPLPLT